MSVETAPAPGVATWNSTVVSRYEDALRRGLPLRVHDEAGAVVPFEVARWLRAPDAADETVLARCSGPTLDIGCGPGRFVRTLTARGVPALGIDVSAAAVDLARRGGIPVLRRSVFDPVPDTGSWAVALLVDGNIGIGADAPALLRRLRDLLVPGGHALIEVDPGHELGYFTATVRGPGGEAVATFRWARIGAAPLTALAEPLGFVLAERWSADGRHFVGLRRC